VNWRFLVQLVVVLLVVLAIALTAPAELIPSLP
jgi:hypothetical protein